MRRRLIWLIPVSIVSIVYPSATYAHVKWFSPFDIAAAPADPEIAFNSDFVALFVLSTALLVLGAIVGSAPLGQAVLRGINRLSGPLESNSDVLIRAACGFFFVSLWNLGGIILTPELKTTAQWISWFQLAIAATLLWRQTLPLAAMGIVSLYAIALYQYGAFHLLDYPVFVGLAAYFALTGFQATFFGHRPLDVLRAAAAVTLMWASVEKWAYPQWSHPIIEASPGMTLGFSREVFMQAAGVIEFALSFALLLGPLARRTAATVLFGFFIAAVGPFGKIDAVGHAPIVAAVLAIMADRDPDGAMFTFDAKPGWPLLRSSGLLVASYSLLLMAFVSAYYELHAEFYGPLPVAMCGCPAHRPGGTTSASTATAQPLSRNGPLCQAVLASSGWWSRIKSFGVSSANGALPAHRSEPGTGRSCGTSLVGAVETLPAK